MSKAETFPEPEGPRGPAAGAPPSISLCMIVKDEEVRLPGCIESARGAVDEIVVVDTGSSDRTAEVAKSLGAKVHFFPWRDDFSAARNESLRHAKGDWILFLDADETLNTLGDGERLRKAASLPGIDAFSVPIINPRPDRESGVATGAAVRFFRNLPGIRFSSRVHENVDRFLLEKGARVANGPFLIEHRGYALDRDAVRKKYERNLRLLQKELEENPDNAHARYHLGLTFMALEREPEARGAFDRALTGKGLTRTLEAMILNMKSYHHLRAGEADRALDCAGSSLALVGNQNTARLLKGLALFRGRAYGEALPLLLAACRFASLPPQERKSGIAYEDGIEKPLLVEMIGTCFFETQQLAEALPFLKHTAQHKKDAASLERLGICLLNQGDFSGAAACLEQARAGTSDPERLALPLAFARFRTGDFALAALYFRGASPRDENETAIARKLLAAMEAEEGFRPYLGDCVRKMKDSPKTPVFDNNPPAAPARRVEA